VIGYAEREICREQVEITVHQASPSSVLSKQFLQDDVLVVVKDTFVMSSGYPSLLASFPSFGSK
jgi:hypothetical protein